MDFMKKETKTQMDYQDLNEAQIDCIHETLNVLALPEGSVSRDCMRWALIYCMLKGTKNLQLSKELYPYIAENMGIKPKTAESSLRYAINMAYERSYNLYEILSFIDFQDTGTVGNKLFLQAMEKFMEAQCMKKNKIS